MTGPRMQARTVATARPCRRLIEETAGVKLIRRQLLAASMFGLCRGVLVVPFSWFSARGVRTGVVVASADAVPWTNDRRASEHDETSATASCRMDRQRDKISPTAPRNYEKRTLIAFALSRSNDLTVFYIYTAVLHLQKLMRRKTTTKDPRHFPSSLSIVASIHHSGRPLVSLDQKKLANPRRRRRQRDAGLKIQGRKTWLR
jgi:hypothetical protein